MEVLQEIAELLIEERNKNLALLKQIENASGIAKINLLIERIASQTRIDTLQQCFDLVNEKV